MDKRPPVYKRSEEAKDGQLHPRKPLKKKAPIIDKRKLTEVALEAPNAIVLPERQKTPADKQIISAALRSHSIFIGLTEEDRSAFITEMCYFTITSHEYIFQQGQPGANFFVIATGRVQVIVNGNSVRELSRGDSFGELALLHDSPRSATIRTLEKTTLWGLERRAFRLAVEQVNAQNYQETKAFIESVPLFWNLSLRQRESLIGSFSTLKYRAGERIVNEGDPGDLFYLITEGVVSCVKEGRELRKMYGGDFFGEQALLYNTPRTASIIAVDNVKCLAIGRERLKKVLGSQLRNIIYRNSIVMSFDKSPVLAFTHEQISQITEKIRVKSYTDQDVVIPAGTPKGSCLWIVVNGQLIHNGQLVGSVFSCVGEEDVKHAEGHSVYSSDILASGEIIDIAEISRSDLELSIGGSFEKVVLLNEPLNVMKKMKVFRGLPEEKFRVLMGALRLVEYSASDIIVQQGTIGDSFFIINEGKVDVIKDGVNVRSITKHDYFGERGMLFNDRRTATVMALGNVSC